ncbi:MAG: Maf family protein [Candidatus Aadella gelida]|nr:Maf family protein [Candidatus Aadella gelida]
MKKIILASASERRSRILSECGIAHQVMISKVEEIEDKNRDITDIVRINAERKTESIEPGEDWIVIGADTLVMHGKGIIGKPEDEEDARRMLGGFSGSDLEIYTGVCVINGKNKAVGAEKSLLKVSHLEKESIEKVFSLLGPYDKAGGFSVEGAGALIFDNIQGSYFNILGLPMIKLKELFQQVGENLLNYCKIEKVQ